MINNIKENIMNKNIEVPLISIIIPMYNVENYISECLNSVISQNYKNLEIIIVDDGSTDNSYEIASKYCKNDSRIKIFRKKNGGLSDARNFGIENSSGKYLFFLDSDDFLPDYTIDYLYNLINLYKTNISIGAHTILKNKKNIYKGIGKEKTKTLSTKEVLNEILLDKEIDLSTWGKLYKRELFYSIKFPVGKAFEDTATTYKLLYLSERVAVGGKSVYFYRIRSNSITTATNFSKKMQLIENTKEMCDSILVFYPELKDAAEKRIVWSYFSTFNQLLKSKDKSLYKTEQKQIKNYLLSKRKDILMKKEFTKKEKIAIRLLSLGTIYYNFARKLFLS